MTREQYHALTPEQRKALRDIHRRNLNYAMEHPAESPLIETLADLYTKARHTIGCDGAIVVPYAGMFLLIERDGYTHS